MTKSLTYENLSIKCKEKFKNVFLTTLTTYFLSKERKGEDLLLQSIKPNSLHYVRAKQR